MSIILHDPQDGYYKLYCKGADSVIKERLCQEKLNKDDLRETDSFLRRASVKGLRTLLFSMKIMETHEVKEFLNQCKEAESDVQNRNQKLEEIYDRLERGLFLIGATVVEDRL
jgi:magnesium-transporting ATPase (P-type)